MYLTKKLLQIVIVLGVTYKEILFEHYLQSNILFDRSYKVKHDRSVHPWYHIGDWTSSIILMESDMFFTTFCRSDMSFIKISSATARLKWISTRGIHIASPVWAKYIIEDLHTVKYSSG